MSDFLKYSDWKSWNRANFGKFSENDEHYFLSEFKMTGLNNLVDKSVLEIGFGNGVFAAWALQQKARYIGTEVIPELVACGREVGFNVHLADRPLSDLVGSTTIDLLVALDVFEHFDINSLKELMLEARGILSEGGVIFARIPSGDSPFSRAIQYGDLTHRTVLGSSAIRQLADEVGLKVVQLREPSFVFGGLSMKTLFRRVGIHLVRRLVFSVIVRVFMGGGSPILTPNLVFVLRKNA